MSYNPNDRERVLRLIQDLRIKLREVEDYAERKKLKKILAKFEEGFKEEYN
ncbi:MAG: hypothetical protein ACTSU2_03855 [Promethearchaeota archaeon]